MAIVIAQTCTDELSITIPDKQVQVVTCALWREHLPEAYRYRSKILSSGYKPYIRGVRLFWKHEHFTRQVCFEQGVKTGNIEESKHL